jgi:hypothetical protein
MGDYHVQMLIGIDADKESVRSRLKGIDGIASWWSSKVDGSADAVGDGFGVAFPDVPVPFGFTVSTLSDDRVEWLVGEMPPPWAGTTIRFDLASDNETGGTSLRFEHRDFDADSEAIAMVTPAWANILMRLKANVEAGGQEAFFQVA